MEASHGVPACETSPTRVRESYTLQKCRPYLHIKVFTIVMLHSYGEYARRSPRSTSFWTRALDLNPGGPWRPHRRRRLVSWRVSAVKPRGMTADTDHSSAILMERHAEHEPSAC